MKILYLTRLFTPFSGGAATEYNFYFKNLVKINKINIDILSCKNIKKPSKEIYKSNNIYRSIINFHNYNNKFTKLFYFIFSILSALIVYFNFLISKKKFDIVQIHSDFLFLNKGKLLNYSIFVFKFLAKKSILDIKDLSSYPKKDIGFDKYLVNSINTYNCIKDNIPKDKILLIYSPLIIKKSKHIDPIKNNILFLGSISKQKGVHELLSAMPKVIAKYPNIKLNLYGEEFYKFKYEKNIFYHGSVSHKKAIELIQKCEVIVLPSYSESLPRVILESIYFKKKILVSKCTPEFSNILENSFLLNNINENEIANKLIDLIKIKKHISYNYNFSKHEDNKIIQQIVSLYNNLLK